MRKSTRLIKRFAALFLVVLMSIESFAAVVSDNDGAAFITKAEFDSIKSDFQSQLDSYNVNLDAKINAAIDSYVSGLSRRPQEKQEILVTKTTNNFFTVNLSQETQIVGTFNLQGESA